jgi:hypothetical protein
MAPAFPRGALTLCPQLCMGMSPGRYTKIGLLSDPAMRDAPTEAKKKKKYVGSM